MKFFTNLCINVLFIFQIFLKENLALNHSESAEKLWAVHLKHPYRWWFHGLLRRRPPPIKSEIVASSVASKAKMNYEGALKIGNVEGFHLFSEKDINQLENDLYGHAEVAWAELQVKQHRVKRSVDYKNWNDPLLSKQGYLDDGIARGNYGKNFHTSVAWNKNLTGAGVKIAIIDDGLDMNHPDIADSFSADLSWDFNQKTPLAPPGSMEDSHGTRCAGQIVSKPNNNICGAGIAYGATISGLRLISKSPTDVDEALALSFSSQSIDIYSSSWGPSDDGSVIQGPGFFTQIALEEGVRKGRNGLGSIFLFAAGNGGNNYDICTYDGYANSRYTITVGAVTKDAKWPFYSEPCAAQMVAGYSGDGNENIATTDIKMLCQNPPCCTEQHYGTSAATPFISGMIALILQMRPELNWRDIQHLIVNSAVRNEINDDDWKINGAKYWINHKYGFGVLDGGAFVKNAKSFNSIPKQSFVTKSIQQTDGYLIPLGDTPLELEIDISNGDLENQSEIFGFSNIKLIEHVELEVDLAHEARRYLHIELISPMKTKSILGKQRPSDRSNKGIRNWTFMTVRNWGENPAGRWILKIQDNRRPGPRIRPGRLYDTLLKIYGTSCFHNETIKINGRNACNWEDLEQKLAERERIVQTITLVSFIFISIFGISIAFWYSEKQRKSSPDNSDDVQKLLPRSNISLEEIIYEGSGVELQEIRSAETPVTPALPTPVSKIDSVFSQDKIYKSQSTSFDPSNNVVANESFSSVSRGNSMRRLTGPLIEDFSGNVQQSTKVSTAWPLAFDAGQLPSPDPLSQSRNFEPRKLYLTRLKSGKSEPNLHNTSSNLSVSITRTPSTERLNYPDYKSPKSPASKTALKQKLGEK